MGFNPLLSNDRIPEKWRKINLGDVSFYISRGKQPKYVEKSDILTLNQRAIQWGKIEEKYFKYHNPDFKVSSNHFIQKDDVVINSTGTGTVGRVFHFSEEINIPLFADSHVTIIRVDKNELLPRYLMYHLSDSRYQDYILTHFVTGSTNQVELNKSKVQELSILLPPLEKQKKIVEVLSTLDNKIKLNNKIITNLEELSQTLFKRWFLDFEFPNEYGEPYKSSGGEMKESELGLVPVNWEIGAASDIFYFSPKTSLKKGEVVDYIEMKDLNDSAMIHSWKKREFSGSGSKFVNGDTLLARITPCLENGKIGYVDFMEKETVGWGSTEFIAIRSKEGYPMTLTYFFASNPDFKNYAISNMNGSSGRQRVNHQTLGKYPCLIYPKEVSQEFALIADKTIEKMSTIRNEINNLEKIRDTLLPKLLSGEIEISTETEVSEHVPIS